MKTLILVRHAKASWENVSLEDFDRPLNKHGVEDTVVMGRWLHANNLWPDLALCSDAVRTQASWAGLLKQGGGDIPTELRPELYLAKPADLMRAITTASNDSARLCVIGHNPGLSMVANERREPILESIKKWRTSCGEEAWDALPHIRKLIDRCREKGIPVIYTTGTVRDDGWDKGGWSWKTSRANEDVPTGAPDARDSNRDPNEIMDEIAPGPKDIVIKKHKPSAFYGTPLQGFLNDLGADSLVVTGTTTSGCVRASVLDAFSNNVRCVIAEEACFDRSQASHAINLCDLNAKYADVVTTEDALAYIESIDEDYNLPSGNPG